jgi:hypothetical protein
LREGAIPIYGDVMRTGLLASGLAGVATLALAGPAPAATIFENDLLGDAPNLDAGQAATFVPVDA